MLIAPETHFNDETAIERMNEFYGGLSLQQLKAGAPSLFNSIHNLTLGGRRISILDVGCGEGSRARAMTTMPCVRAVFAATPFPKELKEVQEKAKNNKILKPILAGLPEMGLSLSQKFNLIYCGGVLQYLDRHQRKKSIVNMARHLEKGGELVIRVPNAPTWKSLKTYHPAPAAIKAEIGEISKILAGKGISLSLKGLDRLRDHIPAEERKKAGLNPISFTEYTLKAL